MVIGVELRGRNLHGCAERNAGAAGLIAGTKLEFAEENPGG